MLQHTILWCLTIVLLFSSCTHFRSSYDLSDGAAKELLLAFANKSDEIGYAFVLGEIRVTRNLVGTSQGELGSPFDDAITVDELKRYRALEKAGLIEIKSFRDLTRPGDFSWADFANLSRNGVLHTFFAARTAKGQGYTCSERASTLMGSRACIALDKGVRNSIEQIVQNTLLNNADRYRRIIKGFQSIEYLDPVVDEIFGSGSGPTAALNRGKPFRSKFIAVVDLDPFSKEWRIAHTTSFGVDYNYEVDSKYLEGFHAVDNK